MMGTRFLLAKSSMPARATSRTAAVLLGGVSCAAFLVGASPLHAADRANQPDFTKIAALASVPIDPHKYTSAATAKKGNSTEQLPRLTSMQVRELAQPIAPVLSLGLVDSEDQVMRGSRSRFLGYSNYPAFVTRAELRLFADGADISGPPHAIVPASPDGIMDWTPSTYAADKILVVYRVYDKHGNFDETTPQALEVLSAGHVMYRESISRPDFGIVDSAATRQIPLATARPAVISGTVSGRFTSLRVSDQLVASEGDRSGFSVQQLLPPECGVPHVTAVGHCGTEYDIAASALDNGRAQFVSSIKSEEAVAIHAETTDPITDPEIEIRVEDRHITPVIATGLSNSLRSVVMGEEAVFVSYSNYHALIERAEVRLFEAGASPNSVPYRILSVNENGVARWQTEPANPQEMFYVYRVYDAEGRFDETSAQELRILAERSDADVPVSRPLFGTRDEASLRTIPQRNVASITVTGRADPAADVVRVGTQIVPVTQDGRFVSEQIVPEDTDEILITIGTGDEIRFAALRDIETGGDDWFIVGQGEITVGTTFSNATAGEARASSLAEGDFAIGRGAFYAKGPLGGDWQVTASVDTGEAPVQDLLSNLDRRDPRQLLRRLNSEQYYPTYGDDSTLVEDAPTQGRFYLRIENGLSQAVIGNFIAQATGTDLVQLDRGVFGALVDINSAGTTDFGERDAQLLAFASDPGTVPAREEFRGTGGSLYFLKRQDISVGSERVRIEVRDRETGIVLESEDLHPRQDYDFDPFNGRLTLLRPLASTVSGEGTVREGTVGGDIPVLVVRYEHTPPVGSLDGYTIGGRGSVWLGDTIRLGVTAQRDTVEEADQTLLGADALLRITAGTFVHTEIAQSEGPGFAQSGSIDGGLSFTDVANPGAGRTAQAYRAELGVNLAELAGRQGDLGTISASFEHLDEGYSAAGRLAPSESERWSVAASIPLSEDGRIAASYDEFSAAGLGSNRTAKLDVSNRFAIAEGSLTASLGVRHDDVAPRTLYNSVQEGSRTDAAIELEFQPANSNLAIHAFGQATLDRDESRLRNNRYGVGAKADITDRMTFTGEVSDGDGGAGANIALNHRLGEGSEAYVGYTLLAERTDTGLEPQNLFTASRGGTLVVGSRHRFTDSLSVFGENRVGFNQDAPTLARSFGLQFEPSEEISITGTFETGRLDDPTTGEFRRSAGSFAFGYSADDLRAGLALEMRRENGAEFTGGVDQTVWLARSNISYAVDPDWRLVGQLNLARADSEGPSIRASEFTEAIAGLAWRPVDNEAVNGLVRVQYFEDLGPAGQITGSGEIESPKQVSTVFSADFNFDLSQRLTLGLRYGYREGRVSLGRDSDEFVSSDAHLGVVRLDYNVLREWDVLVEGRALRVSLADDLQFGALGAAYRHVSDSVKIGVGYSLSDFSDDLTDQSYRSHGPFVNVLGRF